MAKESRKEFRFTGSHQEVKAIPIEKTPTPPFPEHAQMIALSVLDGYVGKYRPVPHCTGRMKERNFDVLDIAYVIRNGKCVGAGEYCAEYLDFKYKFRGLIDGLEFETVFAISAEHDVSTCPLIVLITGCWKTATGKRSQTF